MSSVSYSTQAVINWIVTSIAYTSEDYYIEYGISNDSLAMRSEIINGSDDLTSTNLVYSANITGLRPFTQYYYRLVARNSFITTETPIQTLQTSIAGNKAVIIQG